MTTGRISTIVVGTDFSASATTALEWGVEVARAHGGSLVLVHVIDGESAAMMPKEARNAVDERLRAQERIIRDEGVEASSVCSVGRPWQMIGEEAASRDADLVIVGARGHTAYSRFFIGSTADRVIRTSSVPVLTVHPNEGRRSKTTTILAPIDFSAASELALDWALHLMRPMTGECKVFLLHACHTPVEYATTAAAAVVAGQFIETQRQARESLERIAGRIRAEGLAVETVVSAGYASSAVEAVAQEVGADLIAMGTVGRSGISHVLLGSVAERVLHHASCPVLTVRDTAAARGEASGAAAAVGGGVAGPAPR